MCTAPAFAGARCVGCFSSAGRCGFDRKQCGHLCEAGTHQVRRVCARTQNSSAQTPPISNRPARCYRRGSRRRETLAGQVGGGEWDASSEPGRHLVDQGAWRLNESTEQCSRRSSSPPPALFAPGATRAQSLCGFAARPGFGMSRRRQMPNTRRHAGAGAPAGLSVSPDTFMGMVQTLA